MRRTVRIPPQDRTETLSRRSATVNSWESLFTDFEAHLQAHGRAWRTVENYHDVLRRVLLPWCTAHRLEPAALTKRHLERLSAELQQRDLSRQSVKSYLTCLNTFFKWCASEGELGEGLRAPRPAVPRRLLELPSRRDLDALEAAAQTERDKLLVRVLADTGIRLGELRGLRTSDLIQQGRERYLRVKGKTGARLVPLAPALYARLKRFAERTRPQAATDRLFLTHSRRQGGDYEPLAESSIEYLLAMLGRQAGIGYRVHPHLLRHAFATWLLRRGAGPLQVRDVLGHRSLAMVDRVYSHLTPTDAYRAVLQALQDEGED